MSEQEQPVDQPKKVGPPRYNYKPFDELGFFKNGKVHDTIHRALTCGCQEHRNIAATTIFLQGIKNSKQLVETYKLYEHIANEYHKATFGKNKEINIVDFTK